MSIIQFLAETYLKEIAPHRFVLDGFKPYGMLAGRGNIHHDLPDEPEFKHLLSAFKTFVTNAKHLFPNAQSVRVNGAKVAVVDDEFFTTLTNLIDKYAPESGGDTQLKLIQRPNLLNFTNSAYDKVAVVDLDWGYVVLYIK